MADLSATKSSSNPVITKMSVHPATVWPPPAYNGKFRFEVWETQFDLYIKDAGVTDNEKKKSLLLQHIGGEMLEKIFDWIAPTKLTDIDYPGLLEILHSKLQKKKNIFALRVQFFNEKQQVGQTLDDYFSRMTRLYNECALGSMTAENFGVLALLKGILNDDTRRFLMTSTNEKTKIAKVHDLASSYEQAKAAAQEIKGDGGQASSKPYGINLSEKAFKCKFCGEGHEPGKERCPANGKKCGNCGKQNHFAKVCKSARKQNQVEEYSDSGSSRDRRRSTEGYENMNGLYGMLNISSGHEEEVPPIVVAAKFDGTTVLFQHDTGAAVSVISKNVWHQIGKPKIYPTNIELKSYTGKIPVIGQCKVIVQVGKQLKQQWIIVVPHGKNIFGRNWIQAFGVDSQGFCKQLKDQDRRNTTVCKQNTVMIQPIDRRCNKPKVYKLNTVTAERSCDYRNAKTEKKSCYWKNKAKLMHAPMQGKVNDRSGKGLNEGNGPFFADKSRPNCSESTVLKGFKSQNLKQKRTWIRKDLQDAVNEQNWRVGIGRDDLTRKPPMKADEAIAKKNFKDKEEQPKAIELCRGIVAYTDSVEAKQHRESRGTKIHKKALFESREGVEDRF